MRKIKKWWMPMLLGVFLMGTLVGVAGARANDPSMAAVSRRITVPASFFNPEDDATLWDNHGYWIESGSDATTEDFYADVVFPTGQAVVVECLTLYVVDNNAEYDACLHLRQTDVTTGNEYFMAGVCSSGNSMGVRAFTDSSISYNPVKHGRGVHLMLEIEDDSGLDIYGARIQ